MSRTPLQSLRFSLAGLACVTWLLPLQTLTADALQPKLQRHQSAIRDVALGAGGRMSGQFVDSQGHAQAGQIVVVQRQGGQPQQVRTDNKGHFVLEGQLGGMYQISTADSVIVCRCWSENAAPPRALRDLLIVSGEGVQRGQRPIGELLFSGPVLVALVIAAAIAIPIAVHNSQDAS